MASTSSRYDVFLSFRGEDTRHTFTDHLYHSLVRRGISTFRDNEEINKGQQLKREMERAIIESRASIIILSENYATSRWCLEELLLILERRKFCHFVLPVFYHVDPSHVRNQTNSFAVNVKDGDEGLKWTEVNVNQWKAALTEVANMSGSVLDSSRSETNFIAEVIDTVHHKLDLKILSTPVHLTGMNPRAEGINSWLETEQSSAEVLAIYGMGGGGKTTLAQYIYNSNKQKFEFSSFLLEIGKHCKQPNGLLGLQKQLLIDIEGGKNETNTSFLEVTTKIEKAILMKRALIVLDDIDDQDDLAALLGKRTFHAKSRIIITTRHLDIRGWLRSVSCKCQVSELKLMNDDESLELLSCHAFGSKVPMEGFKDVAIQLARYCEGNPLALKVLGSSLSVNDEDARDRKRMIENWISTVNSLSSLKGDLDDRILAILQSSYNSLPCDSNRELFLHIAFFFVGEYEDTVVKILERDWHAQAGITTLYNRCLLTISPSNKLMMHQLLQEMGRNIVCKESKNQAKRSRVLHDESYHVLRKGKGSQTIEGLALDMHKLKEGKRSEEGIDDMVPGCSLALVMALKVFPV